MEQQKSNVKIFQKFTWKITNFAAQLKNRERIYSEAFILGGYPWRISLYSLGDSLAVFLNAVQMKFDNMSENWNRDVKFKLSVFNQLNPNRTITQGEYENEFSKSSRFWCYPSFMSLVELHDPVKGFVVNDVCIVGVELFVRESRFENQVNQVSSITSSRTNEEVTTDDIKVSWEELKKYRFDLNWLEPHVQSSLEIINYVEKALRLEKWKENEAAILLEAEKLKRKLTGK